MPTMLRHGLFPGLAGNMQEIDAGQAHAEYGAWLRQGEQLQSAYRMVGTGSASRINGSSRLTTRERLARRRG